jgi:hypothetical protein
VLRLVRAAADGLLSPDREALLAAAEGRYPRLPVLDALTAALRDGAPVASAAIDRYFGAIMYHGSITVPVDLLERLPGFCAGTAGKTPALIAIEPAGKPAASVTPSFEVFIPPESHPRDLVETLEACELVRIDRAIVARITKASVVQAVGRGATGEQLVTALASVTRTPVPQNVSTAMLDWAESTITATIDRGTVVVVPPSEQSRVAAALGAARTRVVAPGVLVVDEGVAESSIAATLRKLGILERVPEVQPPARRTAPPRRPPVSSAPASSALRGRVAAYQRNDPSEQRPVMARATVKPAASQKIEQADTLARRLERWERTHDELLPPEGFDAVIDVLQRLSAVDVQFVFDANGRKELAKRLGLMLPSRELADLDLEILQDLADVFGLPRRPRPDLAWNEDHVLARLEAAARTRSTVVLDLGARTCTLAVSRVAPRGSALLVFGDDEHDVSHAIRLDEIRAVAEAPPANASATAAGWQPPLGMTPPPGHVKCPCMSGKRYRDCCRSTSLPS